jgi:trehalose-6-phosphate synthase
MHAPCAISGGPALLAGRQPLAAPFKRRSNTVQTPFKHRSNALGTTPGYEPVAYLERHVPLHERIAFLAAADVAVVTATRDGMNLLPYEYVVCR